MEYIKAKYEEYHWDLVQYKRVRSVYQLSRRGRPELFVKIYRPDSLLQKFRNLVHPKTLREMHTLERLREAGLRVPEVADHVRHGSVSALVTKAVYPATALAGLPEDRQIRIMLGMASSLLLKGFYYKDCHAGNIVLDNERKPVLVDAYAVVPVGRVTEKLVVGLLGQIASIYQVPDAALETCISDLLPGEDVPRVIREVQEQGLHLKRALVKRRIRRSLREGSFSEEIKTENYHAFISKEHPVDLERVILEHGQNLSDRTHILKFQHKTQLSIVGDLCVKSYARPKRFTPPYALRSWKGLLTLHFNRIPAADPVALALGKDGTSVLVTGLVPGRDLDRFLFHEYPSLPVKGKLEIARGLGRLLGTLHGYKIDHADLKASNIKLLKDPLRFVLLDTDRVCQGRWLSRGKRLRTLAQINTSIPRHVAKSVRMAFVHAYAELLGEDPRSLFRAVWRLSMKEGIVYRTDQGDRFESWREGIGERDT